MTGCRFSYWIVCVGVLGSLSGSACSFVNREFEKDRRNPDNVPVDQAREELQRRQAQNDEPRDCTFYAVLAYDQTRELVDLAEADLKRKSLEPAGESLRRAGKIAGDALDRIGRDRSSGVWRPRLSYRTTQDGVLDETAFLVKLSEMRDGAQKKWRESVWPRILGSLKKKLGVKGSEQGDLLEQEGAPTRQEKGRHGERCWLYESDKKVLSYCWDGRGMLVRRTVKEDQKVTARAPVTLTADACPAIREKEARERETKLLEEAKRREAQAAARQAAAGTAKTGGAAGQGATSSAVTSTDAKTSTVPTAVAPVSPVAPLVTPTPTPTPPVVTLPPPAAPPTTPFVKTKLTEKEHRRQLFLAAYAAGTPAAGRCQGRNCLKMGWSAAIGGGAVQVRCTGDDCRKKGWTSTLPDGSTSRVACSSDDCLKEGFTVTPAEGAQTSSVCTLSDCWKNGWTTTLPDGSRSTTSCNLADCAKQGWITVFSNGTSLFCRCPYKNCTEEGATCN